MRGHSGGTFHSRAGPRGGTRLERGRGCYPGRSPSPSPVFPGCPASAASEPARTGRLWRGGAGASAGRVFCVGPVFAPGPARAGAALALQSGQGRSRARGEEAEQVPLPGGTRGSAGTGAARDPAGGRGGGKAPGVAGKAETAAGGPWEHLPGQGDSPGGCSARSFCPGTAGSAACSARPRLRAAGTAPAVWPGLLSVASPLFAWRQQLLFFPPLDSTC